MLALAVIYGFTCFLLQVVQTQVLVNSSSEIAKHLENSVRQLFSLKSAISKNNIVGLLI